MRVERELLLAADIVIQSKRFTKEAKELLRWLCEEYLKAGFPEHGAHPMPDPRETTDDYGEPSYASRDYAFNGCFDDQIWVFAADEEDAIAFAELRAHHLICRWGKAEEWCLTDLGQHVLLLMARSKGLTKLHAIHVSWLI